MDSRRSRPAASTSNLLCAMLSANKASSTCIPASLALMRCRNSRRNSACGHAMLALLHSNCSCSPAVCHIHVGRGLRKDMMEGSAVGRGA